jgi:hypothetical protein
MELDKKKYELLSSSGFIPHFSRAIYNNRQTKKVFSLQAIEDHAPEWLRSNIRSPNKTGTWQFYFHQPVAEDAIKEIVRELGGSNMTAKILAEKSAKKVSKKPAKKGRPSTHTWSYVCPRDDSNIRPTV